MVERPDLDLLRRSVEVSRDRFGLTEMVLSLDEVTALHDCIESLEAENVDLSVDLASLNRRLANCWVELGPSYLFGGIRFGTGVHLTVKGDTTIGPPPRWWQIRRWWQTLRWMTRASDAWEGDRGLTCTDKRDAPLAEDGLRFDVIGTRTRTFTGSGDWSSTMTKNRGADDA